MRSMVPLSRRVQKAGICLFLLGLLLARPCSASPPPHITVQPLSQSVLLNNSVTFSVGATSGTTMTYQWRKNGSIIPGATASSYTIVHVQTTDAGVYSVDVTNAGGTVTSSGATLTVNVPAGITTQPLSRAVLVGQNASFSVQASSTAPLSYQWRFNGTALSGATSSALTLTNVQTTNAGSYTVVVSNPYGSVVSAVATLTVNVPAGIATQPSSQTATQGLNATFSVVASGTEPLSYRWRFNGTALSGATNSVLTLSNVQTNQGGSYTVVVTNSWGSVTSAMATLTVLVPAGIATQPQSQAVVVGLSATFFVTASGTEPLSYQWRFNGTALSGATSSALTLSNVQTTNAGSYTVAVTNSSGSVTSAVATLTVYVRPRITTQPLSQMVTQGLNATFSVVASGTAPLSYQWQFCGTDVAGATNATLVVTNVQLVQAGNYGVTVTNPWGMAASAPALLTVVLPPGSDLPVMQGLVAHLTFDTDLTDSSGRGNHAVAVGAPNLVPGFIGAGSLNPFTQNGIHNYATLGTGSDFSFSKYTDFSIAFWARLPAGGWNGNSAHSDPAFISNKDWSDGNNDGWVVATGRDGRLQWNYTEGGNQTRKDYDGPAGAFGNPVWHHVAVTFQRTGNAITYFDGVPVSTNSIGPGGKTIDAGLPTNIGNDGTGHYPVSYGFWTNVFANPTNGLAMDDVGIWRRVLPAEEICAIYNVGLAGQNLATVTSADLAVVARPRITQPPVSLEVTGGSNAAFSVTANGTAPLAYQWYGNRVPLAGGTGASLIVSNVQAEQAGGYCVVITNSLGSVTSVVATLTVNVPPVITTQPLSQTVAQGQSVSFSVEASGMAPLGYQWSLNGTALSGATSSTLTLNNVQTTDAGGYTVVITNFAGSVTSAVATLTVIAPSLYAAAMTSNGFIFQLSVPVGHTYVILASTNLQDWTPLSTNVALTASAVFTDAAATNCDRRFYRVMVQ
jgi:hypothetical protein